MSFNQGFEFQDLLNTTFASGGVANCDVVNAGTVNATDVEADHIIDNGLTANTLVGASATKELQSLTLASNNGVV